MIKLINISEAATIALQSMIVIARSKGSLNIDSLSKKTGHSRNHTAKIMSILAKSDYLSSERGPNGGFVLKRKAEDISLLELYELIDGKITITECNNNCRQCPIKSCIFGDLTQKFITDFRNYLSSHTINTVSI